MFRYFGFSWDPEIPSQVAVAKRLNESIVCAETWQKALMGPGVCVYTIGVRPGVNGVYPLLAGHGVVLGHLFRGRGRGDVSRRVDTTVSKAEATLIHETDGKALIDGYWGRYIAILQSAQGHTRILRDPSGTLPCFLGNTDGVDTFFSWLEDLIAFTPWAPAPRVNWDAIAALMATGHLGGRDTALEGISQVLPGQLTTLGKGVASPLSHWSVVTIARNPTEYQHDVATALLRQVVMDCVHAWASCYESILLRLSGGVDSAILLGCLSANSDSTHVTCLNYHSPGSDSDERGYARLAAAKAGVELIERERDIGFRLDDVLSVSRTPTPETYVGRMDATRTDVEVAAAHRASAIFTGAAGDSLFFQVRCTWPAADYLHARGLDRGFVRAAMDAARLGRVSLWQSTRNAFADQRHGTVPLKGSWEFFTLARREALDGVRDRDRYLHPDLRNSSDLPIGKLHQVHQLINACGYYDPYLSDAAPERVNPLLSQPLVELCLALPTWVLTQGGRGRSLARSAFARDIPREIANRRSKGSMEEHVVTILQRNLPLTRSLLLDGHLVRQGLLDRPKLEKALGGRLSDLGGRQGEIHQYIALEAWIRRVAGSPGH
jgi:asparagine synthase (glutamine-hydrolysing)